MIARSWRKLGLMSRLAITCGAVLALLGCVLVVDYVKTEVELRSEEFTVRLDSKLTMLVTALTDPAVLGDYTGVTELLNAFASESVVDRIEWAPARGHPVTVEGPHVELAGPAWFEARLGFPAYSSSRRIVVGGTDYGRVSLRFDPRPEVNKIWVQVVSSSLTAVIGIAAILGVMLLTVHRGLRSLARLVSGVRRFEGGDFRVRVDPLGSPEIAAVIVAFNRMAEQVGAGFDSLRESETRNRRLAMIVEQSNESILTRDLDGKITSWNQGAERLFGWTAAEALGRTAPELNGKNIFDDGYEADLLRLRSPDTWASEGTRITKAGPVRHVSVTRAPLLDVDGGVIGEIRIARDVTELKKAQALLIGAKEELEARVLERTTQLALARDEAEAANRSKSAFLAAMSHEIRTPMNGVVGMIGVLEQDSLTPSQGEIVKVIRESAYALLAIVDDVLDFSKIEAGQCQVESEPMDVSSVAEGVCDTLDRMAGQKGVALTLFTDPALPALVLGDSTRLRQVLFNLTGNAIKFSSALERTGRVAMRARRFERGAQHWLEFEVSDNGIGMDEETMSRLFTPFSQADASTTRRYGGTGLGLSISHRLVEIMGGELEVKSALAHGSTFVLRLPAPLVPAPPEACTSTFDLTGVRCLLEGGPEDGADDLAVYLLHSGASLQRVADPAAAAAWLRTCSPGRWVVVTVGTAGTLDSVLADLRTVCSARGDLDARFVAIGLGASEAPRVAAADLVVLRRGLLHRRALIRAVAQVAGRVAERPKEAAVEIDMLPAPLSTADASAQERQILVAEDNEINQKVLSRQLALLGYVAHIAGNGQEALECLRRHDYPLLLTDLHMPQMDGYELAVAVRSAEAGGRRMAIVALTANAVKGEAQRCRALGMDDYMTKPVQLADLKAMLGKWLPAGNTGPHLPPPAVDAAARPLRPLDLSVLEGLVGDAPGVIAGFLRSFRASASDSTAEMRVACEARDPEAVEAAAHKLKSAARSMGAWPLADLCAKMEDAGSAGRMDILGELWPTFQSEMAVIDAFLGARIVDEASAVVALSPPC